MDPTTILAILSCALVFSGWLVLPHSAASAPRAVSREREPVPLSA
jgi:hypothetical protein